MWIESTDTTIAILGYGREGRSTLDYLLRHGIAPEHITILDAREITDVPQGIVIRTGDGYLDGLGKFSRIYKSAGISVTLHPELLSVRDRLTSQTQEFFDTYTGRVIVVSGTKGKSTTASLITHILQYARHRVLLVGNIGTPVLSAIDPTHEYDAIVYELSSYMLADLQRLSSYASVLVNIYEDHLGWHGGWEAYRDAKLSILRGTEHAYIGSEVLRAGYLTLTTEEKLLTSNGKTYTPKTATIYGYGGSVVYEDGDFYYHGEVLFSDTDIPLLGDHNHYNIAGALAVCLDMGILPVVAREALLTFIPLPHRLETVGIYGGIHWYDDAISTTPESTIAGLRVFHGEVRTILLGGEDRGYDFGELITELDRQNIRNIVLFPDSGVRIRHLLPEKKYQICETRSMREAVDFAYDYTPHGTICLLSCASPSYSLWSSFEEKGDLFQQCIREGRSA